MDRKSQYKHKADNVKQIRDRARNEDIALRKEKKEKLLSSKRFRFTSEEEAGQEVTVDEVRVATENLMKHGSHRLHNLQMLKNAFSQGTSYIDAFFSVENSLSCLVGLYTGLDSTLQTEAAWCITNISAGTHEHALAITKHVAPYLVTYLGSAVTILQDQSAWALGNLAADGQECRKMVQAQGVVLPLVNLLRSPHPNVVQSSAFALSNLAKECFDISREMVNAQVLPLLLPLLQNTKENEGILKEASWVLTYLATSGEFTEEIVALGILSQIVNILIELSTVQPHIAEVVTPLLRCLGNICSGPDEYTCAACKNPSLLQTVGHFLSSNFRHIRKETLWLMSNMAGEPNTCSAIVCSPLLAMVLHEVSAAFDIKMEALYVLCNIAYHGKEMCEQLLSAGVFDKVAPVLKSHDVEILNLGLSLNEMILRHTKQGKTMFEECGGLNCLEGLEYHNNETIRQHANDLLEQYFYGEEDTMN